MRTTPLLTFVLLMGCGDPSTETCATATRNIEYDIRQECERNPAFQHTGFCEVCVFEHGYYDVDDACRCRTLVLDVDFCYYDDTDSNLPKIRSALSYAADVCKDRTPEVPGNQDAGTTTATESIDGTGGNQSGVGGGA